MSLALSRYNGLHCFKGKLLILFYFFLNLLRFCIFYLFLYYLEAMHFVQLCNRYAACSTTKYLRYEKKFKWMCFEWKSASYGWLCMFLSSLSLFNIAVKDPYWNKHLSSSNQCEKLKCVTNSNTRHSWRETLHAIYLSSCISQRITIYIRQKNYISKGDSSGRSSSVPDLMQRWQHIVETRSFRHTEHRCSSHRCVGTPSLQTRRHHSWSCLLME